MRRDEESNNPQTKTKGEESDGGGDNHNSRDFKDFVINSKVIAMPYPPTSAKKRSPASAAAIVNKKLIARDEKEEVQAKREYYRKNSGATDALIMNVCLSLVTRGLPSVFMVFSLIYVGFGMSFYLM